MGRSWAASLMIGVIVSGVLLAIYHATNVFIHGAIRLEDVFAKIFILPNTELTFILPLQYGFYTAMAFITAWVCMELPGWLSRFSYLLGALLLTALMSPVLAFCGIIFEPFSGGAAILLAGVLGVILGNLQSGQQARKMMRYFVGRVSTDKFRQMVNSKEPIDLRGKKDITVLTCRILNYPDLSSQMEAEDLEKMSSTFLRAAAEFLVSKGAYLDSCSPQGVLVFFGMLEKSGNHAVDGCLAALELRQRLINLEKEMMERWHKKPVLGVALASGPMSLGLFGFREFQFYSAVGESVDFSRRLCSVNLVYGSHVLISSRTYNLTKDNLEARPMEMVSAPRMHQISEVYELLDEKGKLDSEEVKARDAFWHGVVSLRKGAYKDAVAEFRKAELEGREDQPLKYFLERAEAGLRTEASGSDNGKSVSRHVRVLTAK